MGKYLFSTANNAFYPYSLEEEYQAAGSWPKEGVDVDESEFLEFIGEPPDGKVRIAGSDGHPAWGDIPPPSHDEQVASAETDKKTRIDEANAYINSKQWPGKAAMGRLNDSEKTQYNAWLDYLDELEAVDTSSAPDIEWPTAPTA